MKNQKGEVVLVAMVVIMAVGMVFGMTFMHGGHDHDRNGHTRSEQQQERANHDGHQEAK